MKSFCVCTHLRYYKAIPKFKLTERMEAKIGCGIFGDGSPQPNSKYGGFLDSSGSEEENRSIKRRRTSSGLNEDDDLLRDFQRQ